MLALVRATAMHPRGFFSEYLEPGRLCRSGHHLRFRAGQPLVFATERHTLRGLHFQAPPHAQAKLVRVLAGEIFDVAVDIREGSPTYGQWTGGDISAENGMQLLIPAGFLHGFVTRVPDCLVAYKCSDTYAPDCEGSVRFDDPDLGIDWGIPADQAVLSDKDAAAGSFADLRHPLHL